MIKVKVENMKMGVWEHGRGVDEIEDTDSFSDIWNANLF
jgi:hypothetical protein